MRHVPLQFIQTRRRLHWFEVLVGVREDWLSPTDAIDFARSEVGRGNRSDLVLRLANLTPQETEEIVQVLFSLVQYEDQNEHHARAIWMQILLAWIYENRNQLRDPLSVVETLYADFGYPSEIRHLVRFNPLAAVHLSEIDGQEQRTQHLIELWKSYVNDVLPIQRNSDKW